MAKGKGRLGPLGGPEKKLKKRAPKKLGAGGFRMWENVQPKSPEPGGYLWDQQHTDSKN